MTVVQEVDSPRRSTGGPPLWGPAAGYVVTTLLGVLLFSGGRPDTAAASLLAIQRAHPVSGAISGLLIFASAAPLAVWTAAVYHRMRVLGVRAAGPGIGLVGGVLASAGIALSGIVSATAVAVAPSGTPATAATLKLLSFHAGAAGFAVPFALLLAGVAIPALVLRLVPRWLTVIGLVLAGLGVISVLTLAIPAIAPVLPVVRFGGMLWLLGFSVALPRHRARG